MNPPGRYTFRIYYERLGGNKSGWMSRDESIDTRKEWSDDELRAKIEEKAAKWRGTIAGSNPKFNMMYGNIRRITLISQD